MNVVKNNNYNNGTVFHTKINTKPRQYGFLNLNTEMKRAGEDSFNGFSISILSERQ